MLLANHRFQETRRRLLVSGVCLLATFPLLAAPTLVEVWKGPQCNCCKDWLKHLESNGFAVGKVHEEGQAALRAQLRIPAAYGSCHTAIIGGYAIEGHVPASDIRRLLAERPRAIGLVAPGMPIGAPGMDGPVYAGQHRPYDVLLVQVDGNVRTFQKHG